jgi:hypothetical protein
MLVVASCFHVVVTTAAPIMMLVVLNHWYIALVHSVAAFWFNA